MNAVLGEATVWAAPMMSLRSLMAGSMHSRWMGVGSSNPRAAIAAITPGAQPQPLPRQHAICSCCALRRVMSS